MADAQASGACYGNMFKSHLLHPDLTSYRNARKCRNWQTSKTKDLVVVTPCGFKSHLPHRRTKRVPLLLIDQQERHPLLIPSHPIHVLQDHPLRGFFSEELCEHVHCLSAFFVQMPCKIPHLPPLLLPVLPVTGRRL